MSTKNPEGLESSLMTEGGIEQATDALVDAVDAPESALSPFIELVEGMAQQLDETAQKVQEQQETIEELRDDQDDGNDDGGLGDDQDDGDDDGNDDDGEQTATVQWDGDDHEDLKVVSSDGTTFPLGLSLSSKVSETDLDERLDDVEDRLSDREPHTSEGEDTHADASLTPIERLSKAQDIEDVTDSASTQRAVSLFKNIAQWGAKTPKGIVLRPADNPLSLLEADRDESLAWKQYYRACKALERLSKGAVTFFDSDRHGKMLVLHEQSEAYERVTSGGLSPSSVEGAT